MLEEHRAWWPKPSLFSGRDHSKKRQGDLFFGAFLLPSAYLGGVVTYLARHREMNATLIIEMWDKGACPKDIAYILGLPVEAVQTFLRQQGHNQHSRRTRSVRERRKVVIRLHEQGLTVEEIAHKVRKYPQLVSYDLLMSGVVPSRQKGAGYQPHPIMQATLDRIKKQGTTITEVSRRAGCDPDVVLKHMRNGTLPSVVILEALLGAIGIDLAKAIKRAAN